MHKVIRSEELSVGTRSGGVHGPWLEINEDRPRDVLPAHRLIVVDVDPLQLVVRVSAVATRWIDAMLLGYHLPELQGSGQLFRTRTYTQIQHRHKRPPDSTVILHPRPASTAHPDIPTHCNLQVFATYHTYDIPPRSYLAEFFRTPLSQDRRTTPGAHTLFPIWLPHWPACTWTISRISRPTPCGCGRTLTRRSNEDLHETIQLPGVGLLYNRVSSNSAIYSRCSGEIGPQLS